MASKVFKENELDDLEYTQAKRKAIIHHMSVKVGIKDLDSQEMGILLRALKDVDTQSISVAKTRLQDKENDTQENFNALVGSLLKEVGYSNNSDSEDNEVTFDGIPEEIAKDLPPAVKGETKQLSDID